MKNKKIKEKIKTIVRKKCKKNKYFPSFLCFPFLFLKFSNWNFQKYLTLYIFSK